MQRILIGFAMSLMLILAGCGAPPPSGETTTSKRAAVLFAETCLRTAVAGQSLLGAFDEPRFRRLSVKPPGPRAKVYGGPESAFGRTQYFSTPSESESCGVYAQVTDRENLHDAVAEVAADAFPDRTFEPQFDQAAQWRWGQPDGRSMRLISSRLGQSKAFPAQVPGNVYISLHIEAPTKPRIYRIRIIIPPDTSR